MWSCSVMPRVNDDQPVSVAVDNDEKMVSCI